MLPVLKQLIFLAFYLMSGLPDVRACADAEGRFTLPYAGINVTFYEKMLFLITSVTAAIGGILLSSK